MSGMRIADGDGRLTRADRNLTMSGGSLYEARGPCRCDVFRHPIASEPGFVKALLGLQPPAHDLYIETHLGGGALMQAQGPGECAASGLTAIQRDACTGSGADYPVEAGMSRAVTPLSSWPASRKHGPVAANCVYSLIRRICMIDPIGSEPCRYRYLSIRHDCRPRNPS